MIHCHRYRRRAILSAALFALVAAGTARAGDPTAAPAGVDPQRAAMTLEQVPPAITAPAPRSQPAAALPERAQRAVEHALSLRGERRYTEATLELEKGLRHAPNDPRVERALALTLWESGDVKRAQAHVEAALVAGDDDLVAHYLLGRLAARRFDNSEAIRQFRLALACTAAEQSRDVLPLVEYHLAETLVAEGYLTAAIAVYERFDRDLAALPADAAGAAELEALRSATPRAGPARIAAAAAQLGDFAQAADRLKAAYGDVAMSAADRRRYAEWLAEAGRLDEALDEVRAVVLVDPAAVDLLHAVHTRRGTPDGVIADLRRLSAEHPDNTPLAQALAAALQQAGRAEEAVTVLRDRAESPTAGAALRWALFDTLVTQQDWAGAVQAAAAAVAADPTAAVDAEHRLAGLPPEACTAVTDAATAQGTFAGHFAQGVLAQACGQADSALAHFERAIAAEPQFVLARVELGRLRLERYEWDQALAVAAPEDVKLPEDARLELILGRARIGLSQHEQAGEHLRKAVRLDNTNAEAAIALAELYRDTSEFHRGMRVLQTLIDQDPTNEAARELLFSAYLADRDNRAAARQIEELRKMSASPARIARCVAWLEFDEDHPDPQRFQRTLEEGLAASAPDAATLHLIALAQMQQRQYGLAAATLERALALDPAHRESAETLVGAYRANLDFEPALRQRRILLERYPNQPWARQDEIELLLTLQRFDEALARIDAWLNEPNLEDELADNLRESQIAIHLQREDYPAALTAMEAQRARHADNAFHLRRLIIINQRIGRHDRALELIHRWPQDIQAGFAVSGLAVIWRELPEAQRGEVIQLVLDSVQAEPDSDALQVAVIELLTATGDFDGALEIAAANAAASQFGEVFDEMRVDILNAAGRVDQAIAVVQERLLAQPPETRMRLTPYELRERLVRLLVKAGRPEQAELELNRWLAQLAEAVAEQAQRPEGGWPQAGELIGGDADLERQFYLGLLSYVHQETGNLAEALQTLQLILDADVSEPGPNNDLGYSLADSGTDLSRAEQLVRYAVAKQPRNSAFLDSLGWVYYKQGKFEEARLWLTRARYAGEGEDPVVCEHLGDTCWRLGLTDEAQKWWGETVRLAEKSQRSDWPSPVHARSLAAVQDKLAAVAEGQPPEVAPLAGADATVQP